MQIGKNGLTEDVLKSIDEALEARELIKINLLNNSLLDTKETALEICDSLKAEYIQSIGNKIIIYRESEEKVIELPKKWSQYWLHFYISSFKFFLFTSSA